MFHEGSSLYLWYYCEKSLSFFLKIEIVLPSNNNYHLVIILLSTNTRQLSTINKYHINFNFMIYNNSYFNPFGIVIDNNHHALVPIIGF